MPWKHIKGDVERCFQKWYYYTLAVIFSKWCMKKKTEVGRPQIHSRTQNIVAINKEK